VLPSRGRSTRRTCSIRAEGAVEQALRDALGEFYVRPPAKPRPLGEAPSRAPGRFEDSPIKIEGGGLPDPESWPTRAAYLASAEAKRAVEWPLWRRVDVHVEGQLLMRVRVAPAKGEPD
jgi:hypothetical protein